MTLTIMLIAIILFLLAIIFLKDRFLKLLSIIFGIIALIPIIFSVGLYFTETPVVEYEIFGKNLAREGNKYIYNFDVSIFSKKSMILREEGIALNESIEGTSSIGLSPKYVGTLKRLGTRKGNFFIGNNEESFFEKEVHYTSGYQIITEKDKDKISVIYLINCRLDNARLGIFGIFSPNYEYRLTAKIPIDFKNQNTQKGYFNKIGDKDVEGGKMSESKWLILWGAISLGVGLLFSLATSYYYSKLMGVSRLGHATYAPEENSPEMKRRKNSLLLADIIFYLGIILTLVGIVLQTAGSLI